MRRLVGAAPAAQVVPYVVLAAGAGRAVPVVRALVVHVEPLPRHGAPPAQAIRRVVGAGVGSGRVPVKLLAEGRVVGEVAGYFVVLAPHAWWGVGVLVVVLVCHLFPVLIV